jgi:hypothetical protein
MLLTCVRTDRTGCPNFNVVHFLAAATIVDALTAALAKLTTDEDTATYFPLAR